MYIFCVYCVVYVDMSTRSSQLHHLNLGCHITGTLSSARFHHIGCHITGTLSSARFHHIGCHVTGTLSSVRFHHIGCHITGTLSSARFHHIGCRITGTLSSVRFHHIRCHVPPIICFLTNTRGRMWRVAAFLNWLCVKLQRLRCDLDLDIVRR